MKLKEIIPIGLFALSSIVSGQDAITKIENYTGKNSNTIDSKILLFPTEKSSVLVRNRATMDYEGNNSNFGLVDLTYNVVDNVDAVYEMQHSSGNNSSMTSHRIGAQYFGQVAEDLSVFGLATKDVKENNNELITKVTYNPKLTEDWSAHAAMEGILNFGKEYNFSVERLRAGLKNSEYTFGVGVDIMQTPNAKPNYNTGAFIQMNF